MAASTQHLYDTIHYLRLGKHGFHILGKRLE